MGKLMGIHWFIGMFSILLFGWVGPAIAGAPAPIPASSGPHPEHLVANLGDFKFENGEVVKDFKVSYLTHGKLNRKRDNVILVMQSYAGGHHDLDFLIGPGKALDTEIYFIVATDMLGNSLILEDVTTGPTNSGLRMNFPRYSMRDSVNVEVKLLKDYLGFDHIFAAIGMSYGAMKAYQVAVSYPGFVTGIVPILGSHKTNPETYALMRNMMDTIEMDPGWFGGNYETNPTIGVVVANLNFAQWLYRKGWYQANLATKSDYLQWRKFWRDVFTIYFPQDTRDLYHQIRVWAENDIGMSPGFNGDTQAALRSIKAKTLILSATGDRLFRVEENVTADKLIRNSTHIEMETAFGHICCFGFDPEAMGRIDRETAKFFASLR